MKGVGRRVLVLGVWNLEDTGERGTGAPVTP